MTIKARTLAVIQSHYIPWIGFFDLIGGCTDVVLLDTVTFSKNSFFNRNRLAGPNGTFWLTIPVITNGRLSQTIDQVETSDDRWVTKHLRSVEQSLGKAPHFNDYWTEWGKAYEACRQSQKLSQINRIWLNCLLPQLDLSVAVHDSAGLEVKSSDRNSRLIEICHQLGATVYRTGPRGLNYLDIKQFEAEGIRIEVISYSNYYSYRSRPGEDDEPVSVLENLAFLGSSVASQLKHHYHEAKLPKI